MAKAEFISYTEKELAAIEILRANAGQKLTYKELGIPTAILTTLGSKSVDPRPMAEGFERVVLHKEDYETECPHCGAKRSGKVYWID